MPLITATGLAVSYGDVDIFSDVTFEIAEKARIGLVGPNGSGKTTLLRLIIGSQEPNHGILARGSNTRIGYVPQMAASGSKDTPLKDELLGVFGEVRNIEEALGASAMEIQWAAEVDLKAAEKRYAGLLDRFEALGGYEYIHRLERVASGLGLSKQTLEAPSEWASGGERTRAALAAALLTDPDLLVLDEPTNYLDFKGLDWLETFMTRFPHALLVVSHDRYFLDKVVDQIWEIDNGRLSRYRGNYKKYRATKIEEEKRKQRIFEKQQEYIAKEESFIQRYRAGQRAREAQGRAKRLERIEGVDAVGKEARIGIGGMKVARTSQIVMSIRGLQAGFRNSSETTVLVSMPDISVHTGTRTALIGGNGVGKTTVIKTILGLIPPIAGTVSMGLNVRTGYYSQGSDDLYEHQTVLEAMQEVRNLPPGEERSYLARFLFRGDDVFKNVSSLSGGERTRLSIARLLANQPNLLILDEPTTHLDIPSREALEEALAQYEGTMLFVSHDRRLISSLADQLWIVERQGFAVFNGGFEEWITTVHASPEVQSPTFIPQFKGRKPPLRQRPQKQAPAAPLKPDFEKLITGLEERMALVLRDLETATEQRNVAEISRLGQEYESVRAQLDEAWEAWNE